MTLPDFAVIAVIALIIGGAIAYIIRAKKKGQKCIGCPYSEACGKSKGCTCGQQEQKDTISK